MGWRLASVRARLFLVALLAVLPTIGLILFMAAEQRRLATGHVEAQLLQLLRGMAHRHEQLIESTRQLLTSLAQVPETYLGDPATCHTLFATLLRGYPAYTNLGVLQPDGVTFCRGLPVTTRIDSSRFAYFQRVLATRDFAMGDFQIGLHTGKPIVIFAYPVLDASQAIRAVLFAALDLTWLSHFATTLQGPAGTTLTVVDHQGTVLARYPDPQHWIGQSAHEAPIVQIMLAHRAEGTTRTRGLDGVSRLFAFTRLRGVPHGIDAYISLGVPTAVAFAAANRLLTYHLAGLGLAIVLAGSVAWAVGDRVMLRQVQALVQATQRLAAGDRSARTGLSYAQGELGALARTFDEMAATLQQKEADLQETSHQLFHAAKLTTMGELAASLAHELNNPLTVVMMRVELLRLRGGADASQQQALTVIAQEVNRMARLVADLLNFSRHSPLQLSVLDVREELDKTLALIYYHLRNQQITVEWQYAPDVAPLHADAQQLRQVFLNLLANASDAMPEGGMLTLGVTPGVREPEDPAVVITVTDTGRGIAPADLPKVLVPFFTTKAAGKGTGLGLAICRRIIEAHAGTLTLTSTLGTGTTVRIVLPVAPAPSRAAERESDA